MSNIASFSQLFFNIIMRYSQKVRYKILVIEHIYNINKYCVYINSVAVLLFYISATVIDALVPLVYKHPPSKT